MQKILAENKGKNNWKNTKFLATSRKKFYYFGVSTIMDFYRIKILGRRQIVYYFGVFYYYGVYYYGV